MQCLLSNAQTYSHVTWKTVSPWSYMYSALWYFSSGYRGLGAGMLNHSTLFRWKKEYIRVRLPEGRDGLTHNVTGALRIIPKCRRADPASCLDTWHI